MRYVDGFVIPVPKKNLTAYVRMAKKAGKIWREHGALEYRECVGDDLRVKKGMQFPRLAKTTLWAGYIMAAVPALLLLMSGAMKILSPPSVAEGFVHVGYGENLALGIGIVELSCLALYLIPQTAVLGAILLTGYLGGATASHVRIGEPFHMAVLLGVLVWGSLYLRDDRLRVLFPLRR